MLKLKFKPSHSIFEGHLCVIILYQPEGQVEGDVHCPQCSCYGIQQTHLLGVELPAMTGQTVHPHQTVASIQQPAIARVRYLYVAVCYS